MGDLDGKLFLITGANTGIGRATATDLASRGGRVIVACRSEAKATPVIEEIRSQTGNEAVEFIALDLADISSVKACAAELVKRGDPIDVLINNAGLAGSKGLTADGFELAFGTNHLGHFALTTGVLELLKAGGPARVVTVSSEAHFRTDGIDYDAVRTPADSMTAFGEYARSKFANVLFSQELARRTVGTGITTYALHPGVIASDIWRKVPWPLRKLMTLRMKSTEQGAQTSLWCATAPELASASGLYYDDRKELAANAKATPELGAELWERSEAWVADAG